MVRRRKATGEGHKLQEQGVEWEVHAAPEPEPFACCSSALAMWVASHTGPREEAVAAGAHRHMHAVCSVGCCRGGALWWRRVGRRTVGGAAS